VLPQRKASANGVRPIAKPSRSRTRTRR
jgi:hypothetical protein